MSASAQVRYIDFRPRGAARELFRRRDKEIVLAGPAGTGKSVAGLHKVFWVCDKYPSLRAIMVRKTRASLTQTGMVTFEQKVLPSPNYLPFHGGDQEYRYPNGSILAVAGMDKPSKILSSEWDIAFVQQAEELNIEDWECLITRLRNWKMPYQQLIGDCNPAQPTHWIKQRAAAGQLALLESRHEDNPLLWDEQAKQWTETGQEYLRGLDSLTGVRYRRLRLGQWAAAEGAVYEQSWDRSIHVIDRFPIPEEWPRYWAVDFGYTNPFVLQCWAQDPDGRLYRYREIYKTKTLVEDHAKLIRKITKEEPKPRAIICDHDAEDRATLERHLDMKTIGAYKAVSPGIQAVETRLRKAGDGKPRLFFMRDSVVEIDKELESKHKPTRTEDEMESYVWDVSNGRKKGEEPVKEDDHGCLVAGTMIATRKGQRPIELIRPGDFVLTRQGYKRVLASGITDHSAIVGTVRFSDGRSLTGTSAHPVWTIANNFEPMGALRYHDAVWDSRRLFRSNQRTRRLSAFALMGSSIAATRKPNVSLIETTFAPALPTGKKALGHCIRMCGSITMARFQKAAKSTTRTRILSTTRLQIWKRSRRTSISAFMSRSHGSALQLHGKPLSAMRLWSDSKLRTNGIDRQRAGNGTANTQNGSRRIDSALQHIARFAMRSFSLGTHGAINSAQTTASRSSAADPKSITYRRIVRRVGKSLHLTNIFPESSAQEHAHSPSGEDLKREYARHATGYSLAGRQSERSSAVSRVPTVIVPWMELGRAVVYNLTIEDCPEFFANGLLVHNCDSARYLVAHVDKIAYNKPRLPKMISVEQVSPWRMDTNL